MKTFKNESRLYHETFLFNRSSETISPSELSFYAWFDSEFLPGLQFENQGNPQYIFSLILEGEYQVRREGEHLFRTCGKGCFVISDGQPGVSRFKVTGKIPCRRKCFILLRTEFSRQLISLFFPSVNVMIPVHDFPAVEQIFDRIKAEFLKAEETPDETELAGLLVKLMECVRSQTETVSMSPVLEKAVTYIEFHLHDPMLDRARIIKHTGTSISSINRLFHKYYKTSVNQFINEKRLKRVTELLRLPLLQIKEISEAAGFGSSIYMTRLFKQKFGMTPKKYRQSQTDS